MSAPDCVITVPRSSLVKSLEWCAPIAKDKGIHPAAASVLVDTNDTRTIFTTTDFDQTAEVISGIVASEGSAIACLPARRLLDYARAFPAGSTIKVAITGYNAVLSAGRIRFTLPGMDPSEFPDMNTDTLIEVGEAPGPTLADGLRRVMATISDAIHRPELNSVRLDARDGLLRVSAFNGSSASARAPVGPATTGEFPAILIQRSSLPSIIKLADDNDLLTISVSERRVRLSTGLESLTTRLIEGKFPDVDPLFGAVLPNGFVLDGAEFEAAIKRVALSGDEKGFYRMAMDWGAEEVTLSVETERGTATDTVAYVDRFAGPVHPVTEMNFALVLNALATVKGTLVRVDMGKVGAAARFSDPQQPGAAQALVMPLYPASPPDTDEAPDVNGE